jgi:hypothetical protein
MVITFFIQFHVDEVPEVPLGGESDGAVILEAEQVIIPLEFPEDLNVFNEIILELDLYGLNQEWGVLAPLPEMVQHRLYGLFGCL